MTKSKRKTLNHLLMLGIALILLSMVILLSQRQQQPQAPSATPESDASTPTQEVKDPSHITAISYSDGTTTLSFSRDGSGIWHWDADAAFPLDTTVIDAMVRSISPLVSEEVILQQSEETLGTYGLGSDTAWFTAVYENGVTMRLDFGNTVSGSTNRYALKNRDPETVYVLSDVIPARMGIAVYDMMDLPHPPVLAEADISSVTVQGAEEIVMIAFPEASKPAETTPDTSAAPAEVKVSWLCSGEDITDNPRRKALVDTLSAITLEKCENFSPSDNAVTLWGLDNPIVVVQITHGADQLLTLQIGGKTLNGEGRYIRINEDSTIYSLSDRVLDPILTVAELGLTEEVEVEPPADTETEPPADTGADNPADTGSSLPAA